MDVFDRLGNLLKSILDEEDRRPETDPDYASAWDELNQYMSGGNGGFEDSRFEETGWSRSGQSGTGYASRGAGFDSVPEELRQDYRNLEVEFGAPMDQVRKAYRSLMVTYHPDRFASNPRKLQIATEITKKLGESYRRIKSYHENKK